MHHLKGQIRRCTALAAIRDMQQKPCWLEVDDKFVVVDVVSDMKWSNFSTEVRESWTATILLNGSTYYLRLGDYESWSEYICG